MHLLIKKVIIFYAQEMKFKLSSRYFAGFTRVEYTETPFIKVIKWFFRIGEAIIVLLSSKKKGTRW